LALCIIKRLTGGPVSTTGPRAKNYRTVNIEEHGF
jgi:hypothetical protein